MLGAASRRVAADSASPKITQVYLNSRKPPATIGKSTRISKKSRDATPCRSDTYNSLKRILLQIGHRICYFAHKYTGDTVF
jgi:hypothetical protein